MPRNFVHTESDTIYGGVHAERREPEREPGTQRAKTNQKEPEELTQTETKKEADVAQWGDK